MRSHFFQTNPSRKHSLGLLGRGLGILIFVVALSWAFTGAVNAAIDPNISEFPQCSTKNNTLGQCHWINSNLGKNNSRYIEGMGVPQRIIFAGISGYSNGQTMTVTFSNQWTKGGDHAYDFLVSYAQAKQLALDIGGYSLTLNECVAMNDDPATNPPNPTNAQCTAVYPNGYRQIVPVPDDSYTSLNCETALCSTQGRINAFETKYGNRTIDVYTNQPLTSATLSLSHEAGNDNGDKQIFYTLSLVPTSTPPTIILVQAAGHIACGYDPDNQSGICWGAAHSAGNIGGSPYHFSDPKLDGSGGAQDNQLAADAIPDRPVTVSTQISATAISYPGSVTDTVTVTGNNQGGQPNGKVYFYACGPTVSPTPCIINEGTASQAYRVGSAKTLAGGSGNSRTATSDSFSPSQNGYWCFSVGFVRNNSDPDEYSNETSTVTTNECVQVTNAPLAADLVSFSARAVEKGVRVKWETGSELDVLGFNVWRKAGTGAWQKVNAKVIDPKNIGMVSGAAYAYLDKSAKAGTAYRYKLEILNVSGESEWSEVVKVK